MFVTTKKFKQNLMRLLYTPIACSVKLRCNQTKNCYTISCGTN